MSPPERQPTTAAVREPRQQYIKMYKKRGIKKKEGKVESQTAEVRIPLLLRISQLCDGRSWCGLLCVAAGRWAVAWGRNKPWPPLLTLGHAIGKFGALSR